MRLVGMRTGLEAKTTKIATLTEVRTANVAIQAIALEADADPALVLNPEIARSPGRALLHVVAAHVAVIQGQDQDPEVVEEGVAEIIGPLTITTMMMDTGYTLLI